MFATPICWSFRTTTLWSTVSKALLRSIKTAPCSEKTLINSSPYRVCKSQRCRFNWVFFSEAVLEWAKQVVCIHIVIELAMYNHFQNFWGNRQNRDGSIVVHFTADSFFKYWGYCCTLPFIRYCGGILSGPLDLFLFNFFNSDLIISSETCSNVNDGEFWPLQRDSLIGLLVGFTT